MTSDGGVTLVTGGAGYIGGHVVCALQRAGRKVVVADDLSTGQRDRLVDIPLTEIDLSSAEAHDALGSFIKAHDVTSVIHLAARKSVPESIKKPEWYYSQNVGGLITLLETMRGHDVRELVFSSSAAVYGNVACDLVDETAQTQPINPYGQTKLVGEWLVDAAQQAWGLRAVSLRYFNVAGAASPLYADRVGENLVTTALRHWQEETRVPIFGTDYETPDGTCVRDLVHVEDVADAHTAALDYVHRVEGRRPALNVGTGVGHSVRAILNSLAAARGMEPRVTETSRRPGDPPRVVADTTLIASEMSWSARRSLDEISSSAWMATEGWG